MKVDTLSGYAYSILQKYGNQCYEEVLGILSVFEYGFLYFMNEKEVANCVLGSFNKDLMYLYRQAGTMNNFIVVDKNNYNNPNFLPVYQFVSVSMLILTGEYVRGRQQTKLFNKFIEKGLRVSIEDGYQLCLDYKSGILKNVSKEHQSLILSTIHRKIYRIYAKDNVVEFNAKRFVKLRNIDSNVINRVNAEQYIPTKDTYHLLGNIQYLSDSGHFDRCLSAGIINGFEYQRLVNLHNKEMVSYFDILTLDKSLGGNKVYELFYNKL